MVSGLNTLLKVLQQPPQQLDVNLRGITMNSAAVQEGFLFVAVAGTQAHGLDYLAEAIDNGAAAVLYEPAANIELPKVAIPLLAIDKLSEKLPVLANEFYQYPSKKLKVLAVTGTNGKTSVAWLLAHGLQQQDHKVAYLGTLGFGVLGHLEPATHTTPSVFAVQSWLAEFVRQGVDYVCLEASSHALHQARLQGVCIEQAIFTNLSRDHLDYHENMENYAAAKQRLFTDFNLKHAVLNADDEVGKSWLQQSIRANKTSSYGLTETADWQASDLLAGVDGLHFQVSFGEQNIEVNSPLFGLFNVENLLAVMAVLHHAGVACEQLSDVLANLPPVPGRMNRFYDTEKKISLLVDYAHTPDALEKALQALKAHLQGRLICVFGCGGNRDQGKRELMGAIAERFADEVIVTDDNPRFEKSEQIIADIEQGMSRPHQVIADRRAAITTAIKQSRAGDLILVAGKGHEASQEIMGKKYHFSDIELAKELLEVAA